MEKLVQDILAFVIIISVLITVICLLLKFLSFLLYSLFGETPREQYQVRVPHMYEYEHARPSMRRIIALDTEMVGSGARGSINMLARVSLVDTDGWVYDKYVKPRQPVTDYRTPYSGISPRDLICAEDFFSVQLEVTHILEDCILVGHDLKNDLHILGLTHPSEDIRDTALFIPFRRAEKIMSEKPSLKKLAMVILERDIQVGKHCSLEDAQTALDLFFEFVQHRHRFT